MSAGSKRTWDGSFGDSRDHKRTREDAKDWRDVHLKSPSSRKSSNRRDSYDRRGPYDSNADHKREREREQDKSRRERHDYRGRREDTKRDGHPPRRHDSRHRKSPPARHETEKEEGEISPAPSPAPVNQESLQGQSDTTQEQPHESSKPTQESLPEMELEIPPSPPPVEETLATRRAKRQAILAKYAGLASSGVSPSPASGLSSAVLEPPPSATSDSFSHPPSTPVDHPMNGATGKGGSLSPSSNANAEGIFDLAKDGDEKSSQLNHQQENVTGEQISAADYDPSLDRREDEQKRINAPIKPEPEEVEEIEEEEEEDDDLDDMFAVSAVSAAPKNSKKIRKVKKLMKPAAPALITTTLDSAADSEGYYNVILGEHLDVGRYQVFSSLGKGMFANVVRARVLQPEPGEQQGKEVAIKIVRCQESMYKAGLKEVQMLNKLKQADLEDKKHIVRMERSFEHRGHLCIVFESLSMNLREVVKRFGKDVGLNIRAVRAYAHQLFLALSLLKKVGVMHADIKPDNILVNEQKTVLKLCDLGSASDASENDITPYLVSRFYRAPEIILGYPYDPALDIWSIGCTLYELYTGKILFPGRSNNQMLLLMMELKGRFNSKMIKKAKFGENFFDDLGAFNSVEKDRVLGTDVVKKVHISKATRDLRARLLPPTSVKMKEDESKLLMSFIDLLDKCLALDPARRITPRDALLHEFIRA
ncbi:hypothetical protein D9758_010909 [Tetrapyrgos nigripes]|uniref:non-specific serine/threonine protein kinase n=1 Tax=Tetrapyrgos nigripes TaxID=182062 RepID=A0A8H5CV00_9AGAR|nr:hypothetical protein D9758_010909 [Tetrapyrgos nigripes]